MHGSGASDRKITRILLAVGVLVAAGNLTALGVLWATNTVLFAKVMAVLGGAYVGGRMAGILTGLELGLGNPITSMVIILFNTGFLLLALPIFRIATRSVNPPRWLENRLRSSEQRNAHGRRTNALKTSASSVWCSSSGSPSRSPAPFSAP